MTGSEQLFVVSLAVFLGACLQGTIGFGFAFVTVPILGFAIPEQMPQVVILCAAPLILLMAWHERRSMSLKNAGWTVFGRLVGVVPGIWMLAWLSIEQTQLVIGATTVAVGLTLLRTQVPTIRLSPGKAVGAGVASGVMATAVGMGGPPLALLYAGQPAAVLRGTLAAIFLIGNAATISGLALTHRIDASDVLSASILLVPILAGFGCSRIVGGKFGLTRLSRPVVIVVTMMGLVLLAQSVTG